MKKLLLSMLLLLSVTILHAQSLRNIHLEDKTLHATLVNDKYRYLLAFITVRLTYDNGDTEEVVGWTHNDTKTWFPVLEFNDQVDIILDIHKFNKNYGKLPTSYTIVKVKTYNTQKKW